MPRTDEAEWWFNAVYEAVQEIPYGRVTTYGHIARLLGHPQRARQVGICLKHLPSNNSNSAGGADADADADAGASAAEEVYHHFHSNNVPWQRVVNAKGTISHRGPGSAAHQAAALRQEGVRVDEDRMGEYYVDFVRYGWFPERLPSEEGEEDEDGEEEDDGGEGGT